MPAFAALAGMPLLAGAGVPGITAAAGGAAAGGAGLLAGAGGTLLGAGSALSGFGSALSALTGGGQADYASIYGSLLPQLMTGNVKATLAGQELAAMTGAYTGLLGNRANVALESALGQFDVAKQKDLSAAGLALGIAASAADKKQQLDLQRGQALLSAELMGPETATALTKQFGTTAGALQQTGLQGETQLLLPTATAAAQTGLEAAKTRNQQMLSTTQTNLNIAKAQEDTRNALALQRGQVEGQLAIKRFGAGMAMAGQRAFA